MKSIQRPKFKSGTRQFAFYIALGKGLNLSIVLPALSERQIGLLSLGMETGQGEGKIRILTCKSQLKMTLSHVLLEQRR